MRRRHTAGRFTIVREIALNQGSMALAASTIGMTYSTYQNRFRVLHKMWKEQGMAEFKMDNFLDVKAIIDPSKRINARLSILAQHTDVDTVEVLSDDTTDIAAQILSELGNG